MSQNICNICGANYEYRNGRWICPACGAYKAEELSNEEVTLLYNAAQKLRLSDFDEAEKAYADIIVKYPQNSEGYWGRLLARFGIKYEEDFDGKQIPTCYATIESIMTDKDYAKAISLADEDTKEYYIKQAEYIERVRKEWVEKARKEKPYDIFISYKDSDTQNGIERTKDSIAAQDLYIHLTRKGYRVFFSRESLRDKVGEKFEPYIFGALSTAKVMLVYGSSSEYITSTWVKNEWMRYEKRVQAGEKKKNSLIVACDGFSPAELPKALSSMQCLDATKRSFYEDLDNAIDKILKVEEKPKEQVSEKKKVKKLPIVLGAVAALIAILCCIIIPNVTNQEITSLTNSYYGITVDADRDVFPKGTELKIEEILSGEKYDMVQKAIGEKSESFKIYDIELEGKKTVDINGTVTVKIPLPNDMTATGISAYYISDKGVAENLDCSVTDGYVTFKTTHFSLYVIAEDKVNNTGFDYKINSNDTVTLNKYTGSATEVVIPQAIEGKTVVEIGSLAFDSLDRITSVTIPETVTTIGAKAFYGCTSIESITIPSTVTSVGTSAFYGWNNSQEIILAGRKDVPSGWNTQWNGSCNAKLIYGLITIIFHANGGSGTMSNQIVEINSSALVNENKFTLAGYTFAGWATTDNGEVAIWDKGSYAVAKESVYHLYAVWSANENIVIFNANGGEGSMAAQTIRTDEKANLSNCTYAKEGYTFGGWATTASGNVVYSNGGLYSMGAAAENTLYAIWIPNNNALIFNSNGGYGSMDSITVETNETITIPKNVFTLDGYTFLGWSDVQNGSVKYTDEQSFTMSSSATVTLYAVWRANENELTFNSNDGTNTETSININTGATANLPTNTFTRNGYKFLGWSTSSNGTVEYTDNASYTMGATSTTLYAVWSANENKIIFNSNGGDGSMNAQTIKTDASANLNDCAFEREGYIFAGWATTPTGNVVYTNGASYTMGANSEYNLYAIWTTADYRIDYVLNGGTNNNSNPAGFDINDNTITLAEPTRNGYTFNGWFSDTNFQTPCNTIPSGSTGNKTFYASWSANENTVHFNANGGSGSIADLKIKTDASVKLTKNTITRDGYIFKGWSSVAGGSVEYADEATYTMGANSEYTLYAVWEIISYTITYNIEGGTISGNRTSYNAETETFTLPKPSKFGYTFLGWSGTGISDKQELVTITKGTVGNKEYTANWQANDYTITLNVNGGNALASTSIPVTFNDDFVLPTPEYKGYTFKGWYYGSTLIDSGKYDDYDTSITLIAQWDIINYDLTYNTDGGTLSGQKTTYNVNTNTFTLPQPTKTGYRFLGWSGTDVDGIKLTVTVSKGTIGERSYTAHWEKIVCTITYETNDGMNSSSNPSSYTIDTPDITLVDATKSGYTFKGWYSDSTFNNRVITIDTSNLLNLTLYAKWEIITYTITYNMNGGTNNTSNPTSYTIHSSNITLEEPTRSSYSFKGWYTDSSFNNKVVSVDTSSLSNVTLYAKWEFDFTYKASNGEITITGYTGGATAIIPSKIDGIDVTSIGENAFREKTRLVTVIVPDCIETIGMYAFYGCSSLESVEFGVSSKLNTIGSYAFLSCTSLTTFNIPKSVKIIESDPFAGTALTEITIPSSVTNIYSFECSTLENINVEDSNTAYKSVNGVLYSENEKTLIQYPSGRKDTSFTIPSTVTDISNAFENASYLKKIIIPKSVQNIGSYAFARCESLESIEIPYGENILDNTFRWCSSLTSITIPQSVTDIWKNTFSYCNSLTTINYKGTVEQWNAIYKSTDYDSDSGNYIVYCMDGRIAKDGTVTVTGDIWDGTTSYSFAGGSGTKEDPYLISTAEQLAYVATSVNQGVDTFKDKYLKLTMDICLMDIEWSPIGKDTYKFEGYFNGDGHIIYGLKVTDTTLKYGGLFGYVNGGTVKNIKIEGAYIKLQSGYAGIVCGFANNSTLTTVIFDNCHTKGEVWCSEGAYVGGIVGYCNGCVNGSSADVTAYSGSDSDPGISQTCRVYVGGIAGTCTTITNCYVVGSVSAGGGNLYHHNSWVGGIVGSGGTIKNCYSTATVTSTTFQSSYCGGIAGKASTISNCFSTGNLKAKSYSKSNAYVGRIIGELEETDLIENCYADSTQTCTQSSERYDNINSVTNSLGTLQFTQTLQSENFIFNTLGWSSDVWQINEGAFPTLK